MKLYILSDLHMEISTFQPPAVDVDVIVLAGDVAKGNKGVYWAREIFPSKPIVYVPGNHEFYGSRRPETLSQLRIAGKQNGVQILDNDEFIFNDVRFFGCTLWTDFQLFGAEKKASAISSGQFFLNDFRVITEVERDRFTPARSIELHEQSIAWLAAKLDEPFEGKTVVVTLRLGNWLEGFDQPVKLSTDSLDWDWPWIQELFSIPGTWPENLDGKPALLHDLIESNFSELLVEKVFANHMPKLRRHHALDDAKANRLAWLAWEQSKLQEFSLKKIPYRFLMKALRLDTDEELISMMSNAGLAMPKDIE